MSVRACEKCGGTDIHMRYHKRGCDRETCSCTNCGYDSHAKRHGEHLHYVCRTCGFDWIGDVLAPSEAA